MFDKVLIANRGAIACRIIRSLKRMGVGAVAVYSRADAHSLHVVQADEAVCLGEALASETYLDAEAVLRAALASGAQAVHPGYGFLSENAGFAAACEERGLVFLGPTPEQMRAFGLKHRARELAEAAGVPLLPGTGLLDSLDQARAAARSMGYPVMLKSTAGGGGIGMRLCRDETQLNEAFDSVQRLGRNNFANAGVFLEKFIERARHIEVQLFGDGRGEVLALGERDCSLQRRNQKVVEETPAPNLPGAVRAAMLDCARDLGRSLAYRSAGTVEFIHDVDSGRFYFLEVNTRLQVEHGVTEAVHGIDLVEWMLRLGAGELPPLSTLASEPRGHAVQVRVYAEDPARDFRPSSGLLTQVEFAPGPRCDTWVESGLEVSPYYDPMLAKLIVHAGDRAAALTQLQAVLQDSRIAGIETNLEYLRQVVADPVFARGEQTTARLGEFAYRAHSLEVLSAGTLTTVQDHPGRQGYWDVGVPPSGPMDDLAFRLGNRLLGNSSDCAGLEITLTGPELRFQGDSLICLSGAAIEADLDGEPVPLWQPRAVRSGQRLRLGAVQGGGARAYLCVAGGIQVPAYLGSRSTFTLGGFGGHGGRALRAGDVLPLLDAGDPMPGPALPDDLRPVYGRDWRLRVIYGPHGAPDFFTEADMQRFFATAWEVHYNSSRTGVRLLGPKPEWARADGGEAGLHPSNIHDNAYAIGTIDFTGDMPVILGPDGPSLGGFVCPATVISADRWQLGQLRPGDRVRFEPVDQACARRLAQAQDACIDSLARVDEPACEPASIRVSPVLQRREAGAHPVGVSYRPSGDRYLLVEYGPQVLDINLRFRVHALMQRLQALRPAGLLELTPGIRSLQIHYEPRVLDLDRLLSLLAEVEDQLAGIEDSEVDARIVHLPLSWDDSSTRLAIEKYTQSVRPDAPWCPSNIEFIRRINGLDSIEQVREILFSASYLVMGLGDVYLGAPVATPLDPRHRLVTTKYNPARTWTPENAVGIGGSYLCVYGMEGPGGYQFVGRTLQMWNRYRRTPEFEQPWLLRFFDQIRFYPVSETELLRIREDFPRGRYPLRIEPTRFNLREYNRFLAEESADIARFKARQQAAFEAERERWRLAGQEMAAIETAPPDPDPGESRPLGAHERAATSQVHGSVWQLAVSPGQSVSAGDTLLVLESMKMEISVPAGHAGRVSALLCEVGTRVSPGQPLVVIDTAPA